MSAQDYPVFVCGVGRSGTTLLSNSLGLHPDICAWYEVDLLTVSLSHAINPELDFREKTNKILEFTYSWIEDYPKDTRYDEHHQLQARNEYNLLDAKRVVPYMEQFCSKLDNGVTMKVLRNLFFDLGSFHLETAGHWRWFNKTPTLSSSMAVVQKLIPEAKILYCLRDPRAVVASYMRTEFGPETVKDAALWWVNRNQRFLSQVEITKSKVRIVRYEAAVQAPRIVASIAKWIDLDPSKLPALPMPLNTTRIEAWRSELTADEIKLVEDIAGSLMDRLGYARVA